MKIEKMAEKHRPQYKSGECYKKCRKIRENNLFAPSVCALCYYISTKGISDFLKGLKHLKEDI